MRFFRHKKEPGKFLIVTKDGKICAYVPIKPLDRNEDIKEDDWIEME